MHRTVFGQNLVFLGDWPEGTQNQLTFSPLFPLSSVQSSPLSPYSALQILATLVSLNTDLSLNSVKP